MKTISSLYWKFYYWLKLAVAKSGGIPITKTKYYEFTTEEIKEGDLAGYAGVFIGKQAYIGIVKKIHKAGEGIIPLATVKFRHRSTLAQVPLDKIKKCIIHEKEIPKI